MESRTVAELNRDAQDAVADARPVHAHALAQRVLGCVGPREPAAVSAWATQVLASLALRDARGAEETIDQALLLSPRLARSVLAFPSIAVADAVRADRDRTAEGSPTLELADTMRAALDQPDARSLRAAFRTFAADFAPLMLRNGQPAPAAAMAGLAWRLTEWSPEVEEISPVDRARVLSWLAEGGRAMALDGRPAKDLAGVAEHLQDQLDATYSLPDELRLTLTLLLADILFVLRRGPSQVVQVLDQAASLVRSPTDRVRVLSRLGALAVRHPGSRGTLRADASCPTLRERFLDGLDAGSPPDQGGRPEELLLVGGAALSLGTLAEAERWLSVAEKTCAKEDCNLLADILVRRAEVCLWRGEVREAVSRADAALESLRVAVAEQVRDVHVGEAMGRASFVLARGHLEFAASATPADRALAAERALLALEEGRAWRIAWAMHREDTRSDHGPIGLSPLPNGPRPALDRHLPSGTLAWAFFWDNRQNRFSVFVVEGQGRVEHHWLRVEPHAVLRAARRVAALPQARRPTRFLGVVRSLVRVCAEILSAPFEDAPARSLLSDLRDRRLNKLHVVPHGPLVGLPLHIPLFDAVPDAIERMDVSFGPTVFRVDAAAPRTRVRGETSTSIVCVHPQFQSEPAFHRLIRAIGPDVTRLSPKELSARLSDLVADEVWIVAHGMAIGDVLGGEPSAPNAGSSVLLDQVEITTQDILRAGPLDWGVAALCLCSGARHVDPIDVGEGRERVWQLEFLDDATAGIAGALLCSGVRHVVAFPFPVNFAPALDVLSDLLEGLEPQRRGTRGPDWARFLFRTQKHAQAMGVLAPLYGTAQYWSWPDDGKSTFNKQK